MKPVAVLTPEDGVKIESNGRVSRVRGLFSNAVRFTDQLRVDKSEQETPIITVTGGELERIALTRQEMLYGASHLSPQIIAQTRVNYMAANNLSGHMGSGVISTNVGTLCEGWGMGPSNYPNTCKGNGAPFADATARAASGMTHRIRFYRGGTW